MSRLKEKYTSEVVPALKKEFGYKNVMAIPKIEKVVVNMGLGEATQNAKIIDVATDELSRITGQKAVVRRAKKSIAQFKVRQGMPVGASVTLRGERMYEFLDRLASIALPRVRDFKGISPKGLRRPRQLHARPPRPAPVPRDRLHEGRQGARHERVGRHDGQDRRRVQEAAAAHRAAVPDDVRTHMATTAKIAKEAKTPKFKIRLRNRCHLCGRPRAYMRKFDLCRLCFRKLALEGDVTGVTKSSW